jgi:hypothetical protein
MNSTGKSLCSLAGVAALLMPAVMSGAATRYVDANRAAQQYEQRNDTCAVCFAGAETIVTGAWP